MGTTTGAIVVMSESEESSDCYCGVCRTCRRSLREFDQAPARPLQLSETAQRILDEKPKPPSRKRAVPKPKPIVQKLEPPKKKKGPAPGTVVQRRPSSGWKRRSDSRNHLLTDEERKALHAQHNRTSRANLLAERYKVDGKWYHPRAPHGTVKGARYYCCNCTPCGKVWYQFRKNGGKSSA